MSSTRVAVLGVGRMGSAIARRLASSGYSIVLWNRTREKAEALAGELGAAVARDPFHAVQEAGYALLSLADDDAVYGVLSTMHRMDGAVIIDTSTITPQTARRARAFVEGLGGCYVEAPIVGGPRAVTEGKAIGIVAGRPYCVEAAQGILETLFSATIGVGEDPGAAAALKLSYNLLLISTVEALAESLALAESYGVDPARLRELLSHTVFQAVGEKYLDRMMREPDGSASFTLALAEKDLEYASRALYHAGVPGPGVEGARIAYSYARAMGLGGEDYTKVYHAMKKSRRA